MQVEVEGTGQRGLIPHVAMILDPRRQQPRENGDRPPVGHEHSRHANHLATGRDWIVRFAWAQTVTTRRPEPNAERLVRARERQGVDRSFTSLLVKRQMETLGEERP